MKKPASIFWLKGRAFPALAPESFNLHDKIDRRELARIDQRLQRSIARRCLDPVRIESDTSRREVIVFGILRFHLYPGRPEDPMGQILREVSSWDDKGAVHVGDNICFHGSLQRPIKIDALVTAWARLWKRGLRRCLRRVPDDDKDWALADLEHFVGCRIRDLLESMFRIQSLNRSVGKRLGLNGSVLGLARAISAARGDISHSAYLHAAWNRPYLERVRRDQPALLWLAAELTESASADTTHEPVAAIRGTLIGCGLSPQGWRLLCRDSEGRRHLVRSWDTYGWDRARRLVGWVEFHARAGLREMLPWSFGELVGLYGNSFDPASLAEAGFHEPLPGIFAREAVRIMSHGRLEEWLAVEGPRFAEWQTAHPNLVPDSNQIRAGWPWLKRRIDAWTKSVERGRTASPLRWQFPLREVASDAFTALALEQPRDLWEEGDAMHHCVGGLESRVENGNTLFYSLRRSNDGRRIATLEIAREAAGSSWTVCCCFGRFNTRPPSDVREFAWAVANACNRHLGLPEKTPSQPDEEHVHAANEGLFAALFNVRDGERLAA